MTATTNVHILATCRNTELLPATLLVFDTIRKGFPRGRISVWNNGNSEEIMTQIRKSFPIQGFVPDELLHLDRTPHHQWICALIRTQQEPFWICDTDVIFWKSVEDWILPAVSPLFGRYIPRFVDKFANAVTESRLHTSLLWIDPKQIKVGHQLFRGLIPDTYCTPKPTLEDLVFPRYTPRFSVQNRIKAREFHDTCSLLFHALGGIAFAEPHLDCYDHLNFGTISDLVAPHYPEERWRESHFAIFENPSLAKGAWRKQNDWYQKHAA